MKLKLAYYGNQILRKKAIPISTINNEIKQLVADMTEAMDEKDGIGIAAPQVCFSIALFITRMPIEKENDEWEKGSVRVFINPKILEYSKDEDSFSEGCLSIPKVYGDVFRPIKIKVEATDLEGRRFTEEFSGLHARIILHENDHINGVLFIDRLSTSERKLIDSKLRDIKKKYN
jgi:peptide deformylase